MSYAHAWKLDASVLLSDDFDMLEDFILEDEAEGFLFDDILGPYSRLTAGSMAEMPTLVPFGVSSIKLTEDLYFIDEPSIESQGVQATHIYVQSPTHEALVALEGIADENRLERQVPIEAGNADTCRVVGERLLEKWGRSQRSVSGEVDLVVTTQFREKMRVWVPAANIDEFMPLQKKEHDIAAQKTRLTLGDIIVGDNELIARIISELMQ